MNRNAVTVVLCAVLGLVVTTREVVAQYPTPERVPILLDTDLGSDIGDAFALGLILASPELDLRGVTTVSGDTQVRALMACRFLTMTGRRHTLVAAGAKPQPPRDIEPTGQWRYYYHPDVLFNRTTRPQKESAVEFLHARLKAQPGKISIVAAGPLTNLARLLTEKPEAKQWIKQIILSAPEENLRADVPAAQAVFASGVPLMVVPTQLTAGLVLQRDDLERIFAPGTALSLQMETLHQLWDRDAPAIADALSVALCLDQRFCKFAPKMARVDDRGALVVTKRGKEKEAANVRLATTIDASDFVKWFIERLENGVAPERRPAKLISAGGFPERVHVAEDYENDIERFWWMSGKAETKNLPAGSSRACRGTLTHDFDDLLGYTKQMYTAVIFNPVPGPPMGKNSRLGFRYWLKGADTLRVQIYSLTNGYHRHLVLKGLPQGSWQTGTVDMTLARRPDGTGGPLGEHERIDDIQFYTDHRAQLIIDDVVLYDAAGPGEKRPFPKHIHFTAVFDTGMQGKHWVGDFELTDKGYFWRGAKAVAGANGLPWIRLHLRGERALGEKTALTFRYHLQGADNMKVLLVNRTAKVEHQVELKKLVTGQWAQATVDFGQSSQGHPKMGDRVDEMQFLLPRDATLAVDDVLLYEP